MKTSQTIGKISLALAKAQKNIGAASKGSANPFFKSKYADLGAVMEACKEALNNEGISVLQPVTYIDGKHAVETVLLHESGEFLAETLVLEVNKTTMQDLGSAISYGRRYGLQSMGFIPSEDDDGEKTMKRGAKPAETTPTVTKPSFNKNATTTNGQQNAVQTVADNANMKAQFGPPTNGKSLAAQNPKDAAATGAVGDDW